MGLRIKLVAALLLLSIAGVDAQNNFKIKYACLKKDKLKVTFTNPSQNVIVVPRLSNRFDRNTKRKCLDNKYMQIAGDTLVIILTVEHPDGLVDPNGQFALNSKVEFIDYPLKPGKKYSSTVKIELELSEIRFIKIQFNGNWDVSELKNRWLSPAKEE